MSACGVNTGTTIYPVITNQGTIKGYNVTFPINTLVSSTGTLSPQANGGGIGTITLPAGYSLTGTLSPQIASATAYGQLLCPSLNVNSSSLSLTASYTPSAGDNLAVVYCSSSQTTPFSSTTLPTGWGVSYASANYIYVTYFTGSTNAPTNVRGVGYNGQVTVSFLASTTGGGASSYTITPYIGTTAQATTIGTASPIVVTGLTNGTAYTFKVTATNPYGSATSAASSAVTP
jgi:hypothetical protein